MQSGAGYTKLDIQPATIPKGFFGGEDGLPTWRDALDIINPLEHIPFISTLFDQWTGHTPSPAAKLAGGAMLGGLGFAGAVIDAIFQQQTGSGAAESMVAGLFGDDATATTQLASNDTSATDANPQVASLDTPGQEILPPLPADAPSPSFVLASAAPVAPVVEGPSSSGNPVLDLYGNSAASASRAYQKAQFLPYLRQASQSQIL